MTITRKLIPALLFLLASWTGQSLAQAHPRTTPQAAAMLHPVSSASLADNPEAPDRLAWQRVGSPESEA